MASRPIVWLQLCFKYNLNVAQRGAESSSQYRDMQTVTLSGDSEINPSANFHWMSAEEAEVEQCCTGRGNIGLHMQTEWATKHWLRLDTLSIYSVEFCPARNTVHSDLDKAAFSKLELKLPATLTLKYLEWSQACRVSPDSALHKSDLCCSRLQSLQCRDTSHPSAELVIVISARDNPLSSTLLLCQHIGYRWSIFT